MYFSKDVTTKELMKGEIEKNGDSEISMNSVSIFKPVIIEGDINVHP